jgi:hypothetical protein
MEVIQKKVNLAVFDMIRYLENALENDQFFKLMNEPNHLDAKKLYMHLNIFNMQKVLNLCEHSNALESLAFVKLKFFISSENISILEDAKDHFSKLNFKFEETVTKKIILKQRSLEIRLNY